MLTNFAGEKSTRPLPAQLALLLLVASLLPTTALHAADKPQDMAFFESHIRPVLIENCYACHNSVEKAEADLKLDYRDGIRQVIDLDSPVDSMLLQVIRHEIEDLEMPSGSAKLEPKVISDFERWIRSGAPDPRSDPPNKQQLAQERSWQSTLERRKAWWCFQPIADPEVPTPANATWPDQPIDRFILRKMASAGLTPAPQANREILLRRLTYALTGLPPTPEQLKTFLADESATAYESQVDRLLESDAYGERWARHFMDWLRYAESHGSEGDPAIPHAYRYRDYLIRALNADVPYDQLVREHIAGDLLAEPRLNEELGINESALATAHWRMVFHGFAPTDALEEKVRFTDDQINVFSKAFLGLTVSCARCHNHKFDAISHEDYYALFGILGSTRPSMLDINTPERQSLHASRLAQIKRDLRNVLVATWLSELDKLQEQLPQLNDTWNQAIAKADNPNQPLHAWKVMREEGKSAKEFSQAWQAVLQQWQKHAREVEEHEAREYAHRWSLGSTEEYAAWYASGNGLGEHASPAGEFSLLAEGDQILRDIYPAGVYTHGLSTKHRGILMSPRIKLDGEYDLWVRVAGNGGAMIRYAVQNYPRNGTVYPVTSLNDGKWKWQRFPLKYWEGDQIHIELTTAADAPVLARGNQRSWFGIREAVLVRSGEPAPPEYRQWSVPLLTTAQNSHAQQQTPQTKDDVARLYFQALRTAITKWQHDALTDQQALLLSHFLDNGLLPNRIEQIPELQEGLAEYRRLENEIPQPTRVVGLAEADSIDQPLFLRGNHKRPSDRVPRRFLEAIDPQPYDTQQSGRLQLAHDMLRPDNPLTARVIVNRLWHHLFGRGLVATPDNFGRLGGKPSHPELLDYLATRMVEENWSIKQMLRQMVTSKTWQQASTPTELAERIDPENRLLSHANLRRLEAEAIRDSLLAVSGRLDANMFGGSVGGNTPRRSIYVRVRRNSLDPFLRVFDFPEPFSTTGRRSMTNLPAQSLTLLNDSFVSELAGAWANRILVNNTAESARARIELMYQQAFARQPTEAETLAALKYLAELQGTSKQLVRRTEELKSSIAVEQTAIHAITKPIRERLLAKLAEQPDKPVDLQPIARWEFDTDLQDSVGAAHGKPSGSAKLDDESLVVDGHSAHVVTAPLQQALKAKTLEAWVELDSLDQKGGGVMSVMTPDGVTFDAIVFGEQEARHWMSGSDFFRRTKSFGGEAESTADSEPVHLAICYHADGKIAAYRNGKPYGSAYQSGGPHSFAAGQVVVGFGLRHLPVGGNRMLAGRILQARLYDRALSAEEIAASASGSGAFVSTSQVMAELSADQRNTVEAARQSIAKLEEQLAELGPIPKASNPQSQYKDMARALFNFKEFIYLK